MLRLLTVGFLCSAVWVMHSTMPQKHIFFIPASSEDIKVRPVGFDSASLEVVSLEEADRRYKERFGDKQPEPYVVDNSRCWFNDCDLEWTIRLAKFEIVSFFSS